MDFSDIYFDPSNDGNADPAYTLAHIPLNGSGIATYQFENGDVTTILSGDEAAVSLLIGLVTASSIRSRCPSL